MPTDAPLRPPSPPASYPMVDGAEATGRVAGVYGAILEQLPMVPSLFKSLAVCPGYLELAWAQADGILGSEGFAVAARRSADQVARRTSSTPPSSAPSVAIWARRS